jgi:hypothetical protein
VWKKRNTFHTENQRDYHINRWGQQDGYIHDDDSGEHEEVLQSVFEASQEDKKKKKTYLWQYRAGRPIYSLGTKKLEEGEVMLQHLRRKAEMTGRSTERWWLIIHQLRNPYAVELGFAPQLPVSAA